VAPGALTEPLDICGFFACYDDRSRPEELARGAGEMNHYRRCEPLLGPKHLVRSKRRSAFDRVGAPSCYSWGLLPLAYTIEALARAGLARDARLSPAINVLLGVQRRSGGFCRNLGGHRNCTLPALSALGALPQCQRSPYAERALECVHAQAARIAPWKLLRAIGDIDLPLARRMRRELVHAVAREQKRDGSFPDPHALHKALAVARCA
jgi:hypothetical protein